MVLFTRCITVLTVLLGLALMAVSAYAARTEVAVRLPAEVGIRATPSGPTTDGAAPSAGLSPTAMLGVPFTSTPTPTPAIIIRYPVPAGALPVLGSSGGQRNNLSAGPRVWSVRSVEPRPVNLLNLIVGGLDIPPDQLAVMQQVSSQTDIPWQILAGIAKVESNFGRNMATSSAGAIGYGQFLPEMWEIFGNGGDPYDFRDALPAMGRYLLRAGAPADIPGSLYSYNHSWSYVDLVLSYADAYGFQSLETGTGLIWPAIGAIATYFQAGIHQGIDIDQTAQPGAPMRAAHDGVVLFAGGDPCCSYGYYVTVVSPSGMVTLYAHLEAIDVTSGQTVRQGERLGGAGCTGRCTGVHLHFEVSVDGVPRDPLDYLP